MTDFNLEDFLLDESFRRFVLEGSLRDKAYWEAYIHEHPEASQNIHRAKEIISFISARKLFPPGHLKPGKFMKNLKTV